MTVRVAQLEVVENAKASQAQHDRESFYQIAEQIPTLGN